MSTFEHLLRYVGMTDAIDVITTSVLIYYVLLLIRGTRAVQILIGVLVLVGLLGLAHLLHLFLLGSILQLLVVGAAVTLPIVFQPELRRALEQIGRGGFFRSGSDASMESGRTEDRTLRMLTQAVYLLARHRVGALLVIEQQSGLKEFVESGTTLDAHLSTELLLALFMPRSPLHDGAVIIADDRVAAAGCFLPLADQPLGERRLGTRHRAAVGISEQTDAVVVVVSEETGNVCVVRDGKLSRPIDDDTRLLRVLLAFTRPHRGRRSLRNDILAPLRARLTGRVQGEMGGDHPQKLQT